jgi:Transposase IS116/IS110/IS902 family
VGPVIAATIIGGSRDVSRFPNRDHFAAYNGTAPIEVSSGNRRVYRLSRRGNRRLNHAIHMAAVTQIRQRHSAGRAYFEKKLAGGKTRKEALRALKRHISDAIFACLQDDAQRAAGMNGPGGQQGNGSIASVAGSHPQAPALRPSHSRTSSHTTTAPSAQAPSPGGRAASAIPAQPGGAHGRAGHSPAAATLPPPKPQVQVERPQRSEDERPGSAARRRPYSAPGKATGREPRTTPQHPKATTSHTAKKTDGTS